MSLTLSTRPAGTGTQATFICQTFGIPQISTGDLLRDIGLIEDRVVERRR